MTVLKIKSAYSTVRDLTANKKRKEQGRMFSLTQMIIISVMCGAAAAGAYHYGARRTENYKWQIKMLSYLLEHRQETYDAEVIDKRESEPGRTIIKIRFTDKNNEVITKEIPVPSLLCDIKVGDMIRIHKEKE